MGVEWGATSPVLVSLFPHTYRSSCICDDCVSERLAVNMEPILRARARLFKQRGWIVDEDGLNQQQQQQVEGKDSFDE